jgi:arylsulfatase A-like enzyme
MIALFCLNKEQRYPYNKQDYTLNNINKHVKKSFLILLITTLISACTLSNNNHQQDKKIANSAELSQANKPNHEKKQNIVMIMVDDLRPVLGVYGDKNAHTPNIDALAAQGITFTQAYANVPVCGASRASMLTGIRPNKTRFIDYKAMAEKDAPGAKSLPQVLRESGYHTMAIGKIFHSSKDLAKESWSETVQSAGMSHAVSLNPNSKGFVKGSIKKKGPSKGPWYEIADVADEAYPDGKVKDKAIKALSMLSEQEAPFFLSVGFIRPHLPFYAPKKYCCG